MSREFKDRYVTVVETATAKQALDVGTADVESSTFDCEKANCVTAECWVKTLTSGEKVDVLLHDSDSSATGFTAVSDKEAEKIEVSEVGIYRIAYLGNKRYIRILVEPQGSSDVGGTVDFLVRLDELQTAPRD